MVYNTSIWGLLECSLSSISRPLKGTELDCSSGGDMGSSSTKVADIKCRSGNHDSNIDIDSSNSPAFSSFKTPPYNTGLKLVADIKCRSGNHDSNIDIDSSNSPAYSLFKTPPYNTGLKLTKIRTALKVALASLSKTPPPPLPHPPPLPTSPSLTPS